MVDCFFHHCQGAFWNSGAGEIRSGRCPVSQPSALLEAGGQPSDPPHVVDSDLNPWNNSIKLKTSQGTIDM